MGSEGLRHTAYEFGKTIKGGNIHITSYLQLLKENFL